MPDRHPLAVTDQGIAARGELSINQQPMDRSSVFICTCFLTTTILAYINVDAMLDERWEFKSHGVATIAYSLLVVPLVIVFFSVFYVHRYHVP